MKETKITYRVVTPECFCDLNGFETVREAEVAMEEWGSCWAVPPECKIVQVTTTVEDIPFRGELMEDWIKRNQWDISTRLLGILRCSIRHDYRHVNDITNIKAMRNYRNLGNKTMEEFEELLKKGGIEFEYPSGKRIDTSPKT